jgi:hypothetical protein
MIDEKPQPRPAAISMRSLATAISSAVAVLLVRRRYVTWGATHAEQTMTLPGDGLACLNP